MKAILAAYTLSGTLFTFDHGGRQTGTFRLPIPGFSYDLDSGMADVRIIRSIFPTDSLWVIQYGSAPPAAPQHGLLLMDRNGTAHRAWQDTPQLLGVRLAPLLVPGSRVAPSQPGGGGAPRGGVTGA